MLAQAVARILRGRIGEESISHAAIGKAVGISRQRIDSIMKAETQPDFEELDRIAYVLGLDVIKDVVTPASQATPARKIGWGVLVRKAGS